MGGYAKEGPSIWEHRSHYVKRRALLMDHVSVEYACLLSTAIDDMTNEARLAQLFFRRFY